MLPSRALAYWPLILSASVKNGLDPNLLAAVGDRESLWGLTLKPEGPCGTGDDGNGLGLMQIDRRMHPDFAAQMMGNRPAWQDAYSNISKGASILAASLTLAAARFRPQYLAEGADFNDAVEAIGVAAYNAGFARVLASVMESTSPMTLEAVLNGADKPTTNHDYASDVLQRRARFASTTPPSDPPPPVKPQGVL